MVGLGDGVSLVREQHDEWRVERKELGEGGEGVTNCKTGNRPFAVYDHMVRKPPCWRANCPLGHPKQSNLTLIFFCFGCPSG